MKAKLGTLIAVGVIMLMLIAACGDSRTDAGNTKAPQSTSGPVSTPISTPEEPTATEPAPTKPAATDTIPIDPVPTDPAPADPVDDEAKLVDVPAPIEEVKVKVSDSIPTLYTIRIVSGLPGGCARFNEYITSILGDTISVTVTNSVPAEPVPCTTIYGQHQGEIDLGADLVAGETYTVLVNGTVTSSFTVSSEQTLDMIEVQSPIEVVEVEFRNSNPYEYGLVVVSRLPLGSSCSQFNGYNVSRPSESLIRVNITHLEVVAEENVPCTRDLPVVETIIPLGVDFISRQEYTVAIGDEKSITFLAQ